MLFPLNNLFQDKVPNEMCTALTDCEMIGIPRDLIDIYAKIMKRFCEIILLIKRTQCQHIEYNMALTSKLAKERVTKILRYLCQTVGYDYDEFYEIKHFMTIQLLSDMAGISRETTSHIINELREEKILFKTVKIGWLVRLIMSAYHSYIIKTSDGRIDFYEIIHYRFYFMIYCFRNTSYLKVRQSILNQLV